MSDAHHPSDPVVHPDDYKSPSEVYREVHGAMLSARVLRQLERREAQLDALQMALLPAEAIALIVALAQVRRGEEPMPNIASVCVLALARLTGKFDYTKDAT
jgi:hypothetical protein